MTTSKIVEVTDITVMRSCMCGPHRCLHCRGQIAPNRCKAIPFDLLACPHCGYPTMSKKIESSAL